jgi:hypothetical protein
MPKTPHFVIPAQAGIAFSAKPLSHFVTRADDAANEANAIPAYAGMT